MSPVAPSPFSRRRFLKLGGVAGAALAGGAWLFMRGGGDEWYRSLLPAGAKPTVLSEKELAVLTAFCDAVLPAKDEQHPGPRDARIAERIDLELGFHHAKMVADFKAALFLLEHAGALHLSATRFTRLARDDQERRLESMATRGNELERMVVSQLKLLAVFFYYCDPRTWKAIHYEGPFAAKKAPPADSNPFAREAAGG